MAQVKLVVAKNYSKSTVVWYW